MSIARRWTWLVPAAILFTVFSATTFAQDRAPEAKRGAEVVRVDGQPTLLIDGKPAAPIIYRENLNANYLDEGIQHYADVAKTGVRIFLCGAGSGLGQTPEQRVQGWQRHVDPAINRVLAATGDDSRVLLIFNTVAYSTWHKAWFKGREDQLMVWPPSMTRGSRVSVSSRAWRRDMGEVLRQFVAHVDKAPYGDRVAGYFLCGGGGEWLDYWDYSPVAQQAFRAWVRERYRDDVAALRRAWGLPSMTFEQVEIPKWERFSKADVGLFHHPRKSRQLIDYFEFYHEDLATAASEFAAVIKRASAVPRLVGLWHGYFFFPGWDTPERGMFRRRQGAFDRLVKDRNIDFFAAPYSYRERHPGGVFLPQSLQDSMRLHGKLSLVEEDTRTFFAPQCDPAYSPAKSKRAWTRIGDSFGSCADLAETVAVLKRNFAGVMAKPGSGLWWYTLGNHGGWYGDPALLGTLSKFTAIAPQLAGLKRSASQIALVVSNRSFWYQKFNRLHEDMIFRQFVDNVSRVGAPFDVFLETDLSHPAFPFGQYRLFVFLNTFHLTAAERQLIAQRVACDGRTVLWVYAPGLITDDDVSVAAVSALTGIKLDMANVTFAHGLEVALTDLGHAFTRGLAGNVRYGTRNEIGPVLWCADPDATVLGEVVSTDSSGRVFTFRRRAGLCVKRLGGYTSVWSAAPNLPSGLVRNIARAAGVHIYDDADDVVFASRAMLAIHTRYAGPRTVRLPERATVLDPFASKVVAERVTEFTIELPARETAFYLLRGN